MHCTNQVPFTSFELCCRQLVSKPFGHYLRVIEKTSKLKEHAEAEKHIA